MRPVDAPISQNFGDNPTKNLPADSWLIKTFGNYQPDGHSGEDYTCDVGTPVRAAAAGTILHIGYMGGTYADNPWWVAPNFAGYCAVIDHGAFIGIYGHCQDGSAKATEGQQVSEGQVFILSGNTGGSTGPHLHFEILPDGYILNSRMYGRIDPEPLFAGITTQSATITPQEDDLSVEDSQKLARLLQIAEAGETDRVRERIVAFDDRTANIPKAVLEAPITLADGSRATTLATEVAWLAQNFALVRDLVSQTPAGVLNQPFKLPDGTVTNLAGILTAIHATPAGTGTVADPVAVVHALRDQLNK